MHQQFSVHRKDFLLDSVVIQHITSHQADLFDMVEGQNIGVEVADGHVIKCRAQLMLIFHY